MTPPGAGACRSLAGGKALTMPVRVVRGSHAALHRYFAGAFDGVALRVTQAPGQFHSLGAARHLCAQLRVLIGMTGYESALARHAPAAALLWPGRAAHLDAPARIVRDALQARPNSHLTHNFIVQAPLFEAWAALLADLLVEAGQRVRLVLLVPDLGALGWEDGALLKTLYRRHDAPLPELVLGFNPLMAEQANDDGIVWSMTAFKAVSVALDLQALQSDAPQTLDDEVPATTAAGNPGAHVPVVEIDDDDWEGQARRSLAAAPDPLTPQLVAQAVEALRAAFAAFAFTSVLELGLALLARRPHLEALEAADVHTFIALAAHDRQFVSEGNLALAAFIQEHVQAALVVETRPERRAALLYRLAVVHGRRRKDAQPALAYAEAALEACVDPSLDPQASAYQEAWARNIRALALVHARRLEDARAETVRGYQVIDALVQALPALQTARPVWPLERDWRATHALLAFNTRTLLEWLGQDDTLAAAWLTRSQAAVRELPGMERFEALHWTAQHRRLGHLDRALVAAERGAVAARAAGDALREYQHALHALELAALLGALEVLNHWATELQDLRRRCGLPRSAGVDLAAACASARAGRLGEARERLSRALAEPAHSVADRRAPLLARLATIVGRMGDEAHAVALLDEAATLALDSGERDTLLRVAVAAGNHLLHFGRTEEARRTFAEALAIADTPGPAPAPPGEVVATLLGLVECGATSDLLERVVMCADQGLDDPDVGWELERLLACTAGHPMTAEAAASRDRLQERQAQRKKTP